MDKIARVKNELQLHNWTDIELARQQSGVTVAEWCEHEQISRSAYYYRLRKMKRAGGRRYYRPDDVELIKAIKTYLYDKRYTIEGVQKLFKEKGLKAILGEEIQKDFFAEAPQEVELNENSREILTRIKSSLEDIKSKLLEFI